MFLVLCNYVTMYLVPHPDTNVPLLSTNVLNQKGVKVPRYYGIRMYWLTVFRYPGTYVRTYPYACANTTGGCRLNSDSQGTRPAMMHVRVDNRMAYLTPYFRCFATYDSKLYWSCVFCPRMWTCPMSAIHV